MCRMKNCFKALFIASLLVLLGSCTGTQVSTVTTPTDPATAATSPTSSASPRVGVRESNPKRNTASTSSRPSIPEEKLTPIPPRPANSRGRVLYLGDSFSMGTFGRTFDQSLRTGGFEVYTSICGGGSPYYWLKAYPPVAVNIGYWEKTPVSDKRVRSIKAVPKIESLLAKWDPDIVVVQTGTNLYSQLRKKSRSKEANIKEVEGLTTKMCRAIKSSGAKVYWITPPSASTRTYPQALQDEMLAITQRAVRPYGKVFDSYAVTEFPETSGSDGIHLGPTEARAWANRAASNFVSSH